MLSIGHSIVTLANGWSNLGCEGKILSNPLFLCRPFYLVAAYRMWRVSFVTGLKISIFIRVINDIWLLFLVRISKFPLLLFFEKQLVFTSYYWYLSPPPIFSKHLKIDFEHYTDSPYFFFKIPIFVISTLLVVWWRVNGFFSQLQGRYSSFSTTKLIIFSSFPIPIIFSFYFLFFIAIFYALFIFVLLFFISIFVIDQIIYTLFFAIMDLSILPSLLCIPCNCGYKLLGSRICLCYSSFSLTILNKIYTNA